MLRKPTELLPPEGLPRLSPGTMKIYSLILGAILIVPLIPSVEYYEAPQEIQDAPKIVLGTITAYTSSPGETDSDPFITASGEVVRPGIAACPDRYPFGTIIEIAGEKYECLDRMNKRFRDFEHYDIWFTSKEKAIQFGRQKLEVAIHGEGGF